MSTKKTISDLSTLITELEKEVDVEIDSERVAQTSQRDLVLSKIASEILKLERSMTKPGQAVQETTRIERLAKFIEEADF